MYVYIYICVHKYFETYVYNRLQKKCLKDCVEISRRSSKIDPRHPKMTPRMLLDRYWDLLKNIIFFTYDSKNSLIMKGNVYCQTLSKINYLELSLCESELKFPKLILKNYPRGFEWSKYYKLMKSDPKIIQNFRSHQN